MTCRAAAQIFTNCLYVSKWASSNWLYRTWPNCPEKGGLFGPENSNASRGTPLEFGRISVRSHVEILLRNWSFQGYEKIKKENKLWTIFHKLSKFRFMQTSDNFHPPLIPVPQKCGEKGKRGKVHFPFPSLVKKYSCSFYDYQTHLFRINFIYKAALC